MDDKSILIILTTYLVLFFITHLVQKLVFKFRDRSRYNFIRKQRSIWKRRLISASISFVLTIGAIVYVLKFNIEGTLLESIKLNLVDIVISLTSILICSLAYIYGVRRGERLINGLQPIIRENVVASISNRPYQTLRQAYTFPGYGRFPSDNDLLKWREKSRDFASGKAMWLTSYLLYILVLVQWVIIIIILVKGKTIDITGVIYVIKATVAMLTVGYLFFSILMIIFHIPIIWLVEFTGRMLNVGESKKIEWVKLVIHSVLFNLSVFGFFMLIVHYG